MEYAYAKGMIVLSLENLQARMTGDDRTGRVLYDLSAKVEVDDILFRRFEKEVRKWCISKNIGFDRKLLLLRDNYTPSYYVRVYCTIGEENRNDADVITWLVSRMLVIKYIVQNKWESFYQKESKAVNELRNEYGSSQWVDAQIDFIRMQNKCVIERLKPNGNVSDKIYAILEEHYHDCNNGDNPKRWSDDDYDKVKSVYIDGGIKAW